MPLHLCKRLCWNNGNLLPDHSSDSAVPVGKVLDESFGLSILPCVSSLVRDIFFRCSILSKFYFRKHSASHLLAGMKAFRRREPFPDEGRLVAIFQHHVTFTEVLSESMPQIALHCLVISEFGLDLANPWAVFSQLSSLGTSILSLCLAFAKVISYLTLTKSNYILNL